MTPGLRLHLPRGIAVISMLHYSQYKVLPATSFIHVLWLFSRYIYILFVVFPAILMQTPVTVCWINYFMKRTAIDLCLVFR